MHNLTITPRHFRNLSPSLAKQIAEGDACPISLLPMEDINPTFIPRAMKAIPMNRQTLSRSHKGKEKGSVPEKPGIEHFTFA